MTRRIVPSAYEDIAKEIATSWKKDFGGNYVLVAPPLTNPDYVFRFLRNTSFQESCGLETEHLVIANLPPDTYKTTEDFIRRVLAHWGVENTEDTESAEGYELLDDALEELEELGKVPIILLPGFHKTIEKLSWNLGSRLRNMESDYGLCTVVELPVPLSRLRDRWELIDRKETFICSDFGQGHSHITLTGYTLLEIQEILSQQGLNKDYAEIIMRWSGGLPGLVSWLVRQALQAKTTIELEHVARNGSVQQTERFLKWLDAPNADFFKRSMSLLWKGLADEDDRVYIREHDWKDVLIGRDGCVLSESIGYACSNNIDDGCSYAVMKIREAIHRSDTETVDGVIKGLSEACRAEERIKIILAIIPIWKIARELSPDFKSIEGETKKAVKNLKKLNSADVLAVIKIWQQFSSEMNRIIRLEERKAKEGWRFADGFCGRDKFIGSDLSAVQFILYRIHEADRIVDPNAAYKSILEIPEQILQIYCGRKLHIPVWQAPDFSEEDVEAVKSLWKEGDYRIPVKNTRLGFVDLLLFGWVGMEKLESKERLFKSSADIDYWRVVYDQMRTTPSHSVTLVSEDDWRDFHSRSSELANRLSLSLVGENGEEVLPDLGELLRNLSAVN